MMRKADTVRLDVYFVSPRQSQFKSQGNKLIPDSPTEQALMYQRMFEGFTFYEKLSKTIKIPSNGQVKLSSLQHRGSPCSL